MKTASTLEVFGGSHATAYGNSSQENSWGALIANRLGAIEYPFAQNGLILSNDGNGFARYIRPAALRRPARDGTRGWPAAADLVVINCGLADLAANGVVGANIYPGPFTQTLRAVVAFARLSAFYNAEPGGASDPTITWDGSWTDLALTDRNVGAGSRFTFTSGSGVTLAVPAMFAGGEVDLFWCTYDGNAWDVYVEVTGATSYGRTQRIDSTWGDQVSTKGSYGVTRLTNLNPGAHTITVRAYGSGLLTFDGWGIRATTPPNVVLASQLKPSQAAIDAWLGPFAADTPTHRTIDMLNGWIAQVAAGYGDRVAYHTQPEVILEVPQSTVDGIHTNDHGHRILAAALLDTIGNLPQIPPGPGAQPVTAALAANWSSTGGSYAPVAWTMHRDRQLRLNGRIARTGTPSPPETLLTLPDRHRPAKTVTYACPASTGTSALVDVAADGTVTYRAGSVGAAGTIDLDPIRFTVDAAS